MIIFDGARTISTQNLNPLTGVPTPNSVAVLDMSCEACDTVSVQTVGTFTGALSPQVSNDGVVWKTMGGLPLVDVVSGVGSATIPSGSQSIYQVDVSSFRFFRMAALAAVTGSAVVSVVGSDTNGLIGLDMPLPAGTANIGVTTALQSTSAVTPGTTQYTLNSAATTNAASVKSTAGNVASVTIMNASAATKYVRLYNKATAPTVGTDVPVRVFAVPATSSKEISFSVPIRFATGIASAITNAAGATDATVVAAGDVQLAIDYA